MDVNKMLICSWIEESKRRERERELVAELMRLKIVTKCKRKGKVTVLVMHKDNSQLKL